MRILERDKQIILAAQFNAELSVGAIASSLSLPAHVVRYSLLNLLKQEILRPAWLVNPAALGMIQSEIYFSLNAQEQKDRTQFIQTLSESGETIWQAELGGTYQYGASILTQNIWQLSELIERCTQSSKQLAIRRQISQIISLAIFKKKYLAPETRSTQYFLLSSKSPRVELDQTDRAVLTAAYTNPSEPTERLASRLGLPRTTFDHRLKALIKSGVLLSKIYYVSAAKLGLLNYKLLIYSRGASPEMSTKFFEFCKKHPRITLYIHSLGAWDYCCNLELETQAEVTTVVQQLYDTFGNWIEQIEILPVLKQTTAKTIKL